MLRILRQDPCDTANAVAALLHFGAVRIEYSIACCMRRISWLAYPHQLIETGSGGFVTEFAEFRRNRWLQFFSTLIDNEYFVASAVHFEVGGLHFRSVTVAKNIEWTFVLGLCSFT